VSARLVVVGSLNQDIVLEVPRLPGPGDTVLGVRPATAGFGGKGANQAAAAATFLEHPGAVALVGRVGDDEAGEAMLEDLRRRGADVTGVRRSAGPSGTATVALDPHGENLILVDPGANAALTAEDVRVPLVADATVLLLQLEVPIAAVRAALDHTQGRVVLNPAPAGNAAAFVRDVDVLVPNRLELAEIVGAAPATDVDEALDQARRLGARADLVVTMGREGALVLTAAGRAELVAAPPVEAVDSTGAGDCFCGVLASLLTEGVDIVEATRAAVVAASSSVLGRGARGALPSRAEVTRQLTRLRHVTQEPSRWQQS
jgi:ribokinase